jgi:anti-sigma regulatory factor (Ser/Thr protein kinase)
MPNNEIFIGGDKNITLLNLANLTTRVVNITASNNGAFKYYFDFHANKGKYYIATHQQGIVVTDEAFKVQYLLSTENGLTDNGVYCLLPEGDSAIWVSSNNGLTRISLTDYRTRQFFTKDGLHHDSFEEFSSVKKNSTIYFGGVGGITRVEPKKLATSAEGFPLYFTNCTMVAAGKKIDTVVNGLTELDIPNFINQTNINFAAIHYPAFQDIYYQYSFSPNQSNWLANGHQNYVTLMGMSPGIYTLAVRASLNNVDWGSPKFLKISVLPKWYQTTLFKIVLALTGFGLIFLFYWNRVNQLEAKQNIRKEIASDLHDDLGSTLNSIKVLTHLAKSDPRHLDQIETSLSSASGGLRDMIWVLDDTEDTLGELASRISKTVLPTLTALNINFQVEISHELREDKITKLEKKNILLIIKEAINNSVKYAQCQHIILNIRKQTGKLVITIADDGIGFNMEMVKQGYGLQNMKNRAQQLSYNIQIISNNHEGTTIIASPSS